MDPIVSPVELLRSYVWAVLKANTGMKESDYGGLIPITSSEAPELTYSDRPYIVYGYSGYPAPSGQHYKKRGVMTFVVHSTNVAEISKILTILDVALGREDDSAADLNAFTSKKPGLIGMRFGTISVQFVEGAVPEESEGGRHTGVISVRFEYYVDYNVETSV